VGARRWIPDCRWEGEDCYVVGGGPSLRDFDWDRIRGARVIGCNSAFILGAGIVEILLFADYEWWKRIGEDRLQEFGGLVVGCCPRLEEDGLENLPGWLLLAEREGDRNGLSVGPKLHFNGNCGAMAIHLALALGARRVNLLGFDMKAPSRDRANWHDVRCEPGNPDVYKYFAASFDTIARDLHKYPGAVIVNVTDVSDLRCFPRESISEHFAGRRLARRKVCAGR
jgi:hypothetical protein